MHDDERLFRALNDETAIVRWLESLDYSKKLVLIERGDRLTQWSIAVSFFEAAESLREIVLSFHGNDLFRREFPMLYLYRHSIELFLKDTLNQKENGHNLSGLLGKLVEQIKQQHNVDVSAGWFASEIRHLSEIDPTSQGFRYSHKIDTSPAIADSYILDIEDLGKRMRSLYDVFRGMRLARGKFNNNGRDS
jgi:hypothetical protein